MTTLNLGVIDLPYADEGSTSTGDVATILEAHYGVMGVFFEKNKEAIAGMLEKSYGAAFEALNAPTPVRIDPQGQAGTEIKERFDNFITTRQLDHVVAGVPTQAAIDRAAGARRSTRFVRRRKPKRRGAKAVSFYDTGLFLSAFKAWVE